ncbi:MAG: tRNA (cytidine(34)-2'-O)-methyltransferase [Myxococcota bacterium]|nr:tRNA (cytidine(34)-2'-O)-methyltransferase [Myxococcota bacterium]
MTGASPSEPALHVVLVEPLIPQNTGSVGRLCVATGTRLHLVEPLGFDIDEKRVRRAGLDYWSEVDLCVHEDWAACRQAIGIPSHRWYFFSSHASQPYDEAAYQEGDVLVFGKETEGLGADLLGELPSQARTIPLFGPVRSLNLSTSVGIVVYEALRQMHKWSTD